MTQRGVDLNTPQACQIAATFLRDATLDRYVSHQQQVTAGTAQQLSLRLATDERSIPAAFLAV
jgi:hypothetical protein